MKYHFVILILLALHCSNALENNPEAIEEYFVVESLTELPACSETALGIYWIKEEAALYICDGNNYQIYVKPEDLPATITSLYDSSANKLGQYLYSQTVNNLHYHYIKTPLLNQIVGLAQDNYNGELGLVLEEPTQFIYYQNSQCNDIPVLASPNNNLYFDTIGIITEKQSMAPFNYGLYLINDYYMQSETTVLTSQLYYLVNGFCTSAGSTGTRYIFPIEEITFADLGWPNEIALPLEIK